MRRLDRWWLFRRRLSYSDSSAIQWLGDQLYRIERRFQGAGSVELGTYKGTAGALYEDSIDIAWSGACPVQGWGFVDGHICYYRSRGEGWEFNVAAKPGGNPNDEAEMQAVFDEGAWAYSEQPYIHPDGGWVSSSVSERCIRKAIAKWRVAGTWQ